MNEKRIFYKKRTCGFFSLGFRIFAAHIFPVFLFFFAAGGLSRFFPFPFPFPFPFLSFLLFRNFQKRKGESGDVFPCLPPRSGRKRKRLVGRGSCNSVCGYGGKVLFCRENPRFFLPAFSTFSEYFRWTEFLITFPTVSTSFPQGKRG